LEDVPGEAGAVEAGRAGAAVDVGGADVAEGDVDDGVARGGRGGRDARGGRGLRGSGRSGGARGGLGGAGLGERLGLRGGGGLASGLLGRGALGDRDGVLGDRGLRRGGLDTEVGDGELDVGRDRDGGAHGEGRTCLARERGDVDLREGGTLRGGDGRAGRHGQ